MKGNSQQHGKRFVEIDVPQKITSKDFGFVISKCKGMKEKPRLKKEERKITAHVSGEMEEKAFRKKWCLAFAEFRPKSSFDRFSCVNSTIDDKAAVRVVGDECSFDDSISCEEPGNLTEQKFMEFFKKHCSSNKGMTTYKLQFRFGAIKSWEFETCKTVQNLRKAIERKARFETGLDLGEDRLFEVDPIETRIHTFKIAYNNTAYSMGAEKCAKGFEMTDLSESPNTVFQIDTLNPNMPAIRMQLQKKEQIQDGKLREIFKSICTNIKTKDDGSFDVECPADFYLMHKRTKDRSRYEIGEAVWDLQKVVYEWDYEKEPSIETKTEVEMCSQRFERDEDRENIDWITLMKEAWEMASTF